MFIEDIRNDFYNVLLGNVCIVFVYYIHFSHGLLFFMMNFLPEGFITGSLRCGCDLCV